MAYSVMVEFLVTADDPDEALTFLESSLEYFTENEGIASWCIPDPGAVPATPEQHRYLREIAPDGEERREPRTAVE